MEARQIPGPAGEAYLQYTPLSELSRQSTAAVRSRCSINQP
ncbi:hypothetical protein OPIT5_14985 [Opitutaceae bacterium TAV5]|nr:hypothetical protein OPIT5_14985 [Opitutaceae bacterium TAV5]